MSITCPQCLTVYQVKMTASSARKKMKCKKCQHMWVPLDDPMLAVQFQDHDAESQASADDVRGEVAAFTGEAARAPLREDGEDAREQQVRLNASLQSMKTSSLISDISKKAESEEHQRAADSGFLSRGRGRGLNFALLEFVLASGFVVVFFALLFVFRESVVSLFPDLAGLYELVGVGVNVTGLEFQNLSVSLSRLENIPTLVIVGDIQNISSQVVDVPKIQFSVLSEVGTELYTWVIPAPEPQLGAGDVVRFEGQLVDPPSDTHTISTVFLDETAL